MEISNGKQGFESRKADREQDTEKERKHTFELESVFEEDSVLWGRWEENENYKSACSHVLMWLIVGN